MAGKDIVVFSMLFFTLCVSGAEQRFNTELTTGFFTPNEGVEKIKVVGTAEYIGVSDYEKKVCPSQMTCLHLDAWQLYEIEAYVLPESQETRTLQVAHRYGSALNTSAAWFATIEKISDSSLSKKIGADYLLVGVEFGYQVFCPSENSGKFFQGWIPDFIKKDGKECFSL